MSISYLVEKIKLWRQISNFFWLFVASSTVGFAILVGAVFHFFSNRGMSQQEETGGKNVPVTVEMAKRRTLGQYFSTYSFLLPRKEVTLRPNQNVTIREVKVEVGQRVEKDNVLASMDSEVQNLRAQLEQIDSQLRNLDFNVTLALAKKSFLSSKEFQEKELQHKANKIRQRLSEIETTGALLAPIDGMVSEINLKVGDYIDNPANYSLKIMDASNFRVQLYLPQNVTAKLKKGDEVTLSRSNMDDKGIENKVSSPAIITAISPVVDQKSGAVFTEIETEPGKAPDSWISGQYVEVYLATERADNAVTVPNVALIYENNNYYVFRISNTEKQNEEAGLRRPANSADEVTGVQKVPVTVGIKDSHYTQITSGISEFDMVVLEGQGGLSDGAKVEIVRFEKGL